MKKPQEPLDKLPAVHALETTSRPTIESYASAAAEYYRLSGGLSDGSKKRAQIVLSAALARTLAADLTRRLPQLHAQPRETPVAGALRVVRADVSEFHKLDGLRLAVELKPVNLAVGRAIWNRFGDIRTFAVNVHLKFPFAVVGGVLTIPTLERKEGREYRTDQLIDRATERLVRAGGRRSEADAPHLIEGVALVAYDPYTGLIDPQKPVPGCGLRWPEFIDALTTAYLSRFEGVEEAVQEEMGAADLAD